MSPNPESILAMDSVKWAEAVGTRFKPDDETLAGHYLVRKVSGQTDGPIFQLIKEVDIYQHEPSQLSSFAHDFGDRNMYFFTTLQMENRTGTNFNRLAPGGYWEETETPSDVKDKDGKVVAAKTLLAYYKNDLKSGKPVKTRWLMKEYMLLQKQCNGELRMLAPLTLCVVYILDNKKRGYGEEENNQSSFPDYCEPNLVMSSAENPKFPRKRHRPYSDLQDKLYIGVSTSSNQNQGSESSSKPVANPFANSEKNMLNGTTDSNVHIPNRFLESDPSMNPDDDEALCSLADLFSND